jgi:phosphoribosylformylglycinamidine synthase
VITGDGINCEQETARAFRRAGAEADIVHINDWLASPRLLAHYQLLALPGGFSFADYLGAGHVMALKIKQGAFDELQEFIASGKGVLGICNGLQILLRLGVLPGGSAEPSITLSHNSDGKFVDKWVGIRKGKNSICRWTELLDDEEFYLPIRHGEGRFVFADSWAGHGVTSLGARGQIALQYSSDINGSAGLIAGICNEGGNVLGLMPHPESALFAGTSSLANGRDGLGLALIKAGVEYVVNC